MKLSIHPLATADLTQAFDYYRERSSSAAERFVAEVHSTYQMLAEFPRAGKPLEDEIRGFPVRGFPYTVVYRLLPGRLRILAVFHQSRRPRTWRGRR